jgi:L-threonylcarbamoyladenylate synthase
VADDDVRRAIDAIRRGEPAILPTDTVYGLVASPYRAEPTSRLYRLKGRKDGKPTALIAASVDMLFECVPELRGRAGVMARALLPGPYTLVLPNPARRYRWLTGTRQDAIGVRVPELPEPARLVTDAIGCLVATSANEPGEPAATTVAEIPQRIRDGCGAIVDIGPLAGTPSTVLDLTGEEPVVIREGAVPAAEALARVRSALAA